MKLIISFFLIFLTINNINAQTSFFGEDVNQLLKEAKQGDAEAQDKIASLYFLGDGVDIDIYRAIYWWEKSANQGNCEAKRTLADYFYIKGYSNDEYELEIKPDPSKAINYYMECAKQGDSGSQWELIKIYDEGKVVTKDESKAMFWSEKWAEQTTDGTRYFKLASSILEDDYYKCDRAYYFLEKSAEQGYKKAEVYLLSFRAAYYSNGICGSLIDMKKAAKLAKKIIDSANHPFKNDVKLVWDDYELWKYL